MPVSRGLCADQNFFRSILEDTSKMEDASLNQHATENDKMDESEESSRGKVIGRLDWSSKDKDKSDQDAYHPSPPPEKLSSAQRAKQKAQYSKPIACRAMSSTPTAPRDHRAKRRASSTKVCIQPDEAPEKPVYVKVKLRPRKTIKGPHRCVCQPHGFMLADLMHQQGSLKRKGPPPWM